MLFSVVWKTKITIITIIWDMTPCKLVDVSRRFGGKFHLDLQGKEELMYSKF